MIKKIPIGPVQGDYVIPNIIGRIEKVKVKYANPSAEDVNLIISTGDGEEILNITGSKDGIWYPRNWNIQNQQYSGINIAGEGQSVMNAERWLVFGSLYIKVTGSLKEDYIKNIEITYEEENQDYFLMKEEGAVTTETPRVSNPSYGGPRDRKRRKYFLTNYLKSELSYITKDTSHQDMLINKADDLRDFIENSVFTRKFDGVTKSMSDLIKDFIIRAITKGYNQERVMKYLDRKGIPKSQARNIFRTENHELRNKVREWSYNQLPGEQKVKWIGPNDGRTTNICANIKNKSRKGVTIEELQKIIGEEVEMAISKGELPSNFDPREYTPHFGCRHTFIKI
jgi:hypothetical protein